MLIIPTLNGENKFRGFCSGTIYAITVEGKTVEAALKIYQP